MANYQIKAGTTLESFNTLGDWTFLTGSGQIKTNGLEITSAVGGNSVATKVINTTLGQLGAGLLTVNVASATDLANIDSIELFISSSTSLAQYFHVSYRGGGSVSSGGDSSDLHEGVNKLPISRASWDNPAAAESWSNTMVRLRVRVNAAAGVAATVSFTEFSFGEYHRPKCVLIFDDSRLTIYQNAYPYMKARGLKGTIPVNSGFVDVFPGTYASTANLIEMYNAGWDMVNHTDTHPHCGQVALADAKTAIDNCAAYLLANGFTRNNCHKHFVWPYGNYNDAIRSYVESQGYITQRTTHGGRDNYSAVDNVLLSWQNFIPADSLATAQGCIDRAIGAGATMFLTFHSITSPTSQNIEWDTSNFQALIDYIYSKKEQIDVVTLTEWYRGLSQNRRLA